jgi:hypothetical protein
MALRENPVAERANRRGMAVPRVGRALALMPNPLNLWGLGRRLVRTYLYLRLIPNTNFIEASLPGPGSSGVKNHPSPTVPS